MTLFQRPTPQPFPVPSACPQVSTVRGALLMELIAPQGRALPAVSGWELRVWPLARLGDLTLEARPLCPAPAGDLLAALRAAGFTPLGLRERR